MYRTCIYCQRDLGTNDVVEEFPIGRRLAFDGEKGRLWVICARCRRWNLTPLEERWEAIEECERRFRDATTRFSTDNIGLAQLDEGLQLVRVGRPRRPEFAAWRYSREFWRRRLKGMAGSVIGGAGFVAVAWAATTVPFVGVAASIWWTNRVAARLRDEEGRTLHVTRMDLAGVELVRDEGPEGWALLVPHYRRELGVPMWRGEKAAFTGPAAVGAAGTLLPRLNRLGGSDRQVREAVTLIEEAGDPEAVFARAAVERGSIRSSTWGFDVSATTVRGMSPRVRLALEMAGHEDSERRALEGELALLEAAWREAEEIAAIADRLLIPPKIEEWIRRHRGEHAGHSS